MIGRDRDLHAGRVAECRDDVPQDPRQRPKFCCSGLGRKESRITTSILYFCWRTVGFASCRKVSSVNHINVHFLHHLPPPLRLWDVPATICCCGAEEASLINKVPIQKKTAIAKPGPGLLTKILSLKKKPFESAGTDKMLVFSSSAFSSHVLLHPHPSMTKSRGGRELYLSVSKKDVKRISDFCSVCKGRGSAKG